MTGIELVRQYFPDASDDFAGYILWNKTGFPSFYLGNNPVEYFGQQIAQFKKLYDAGELICELCNSKVIINGLCQDCYDVLYNID